MLRRNIPLLREIAVLFRKIGIAAMSVTPHEAARDMTRSAAAGGAVPESAISLPGCA